MKKQILFLFMLELYFILANLGWAITLWGSVKTHDGYVPDNPSLTFICFIKETDNLIRTEDSSGATYESGFYQDETSNYPGVDVGDKYDIYFTDIAKGEAEGINISLPNQTTKMDVTLAPSSNPPVPIGLKASVPFEGTVRLTWDYVEGLTYHIYRRITDIPYYTRVDDNTGLSRGVAEAYYDDTITDSLHSYQYILVAEDNMGRLSGHTDEVDNNSFAIKDVIVLDITDTEATINWKTDVPATSQMEYGLDTQYGSISDLDATYKTDHSVKLSGLSRNTEYYYRVISLDEFARKALSGNYTFKTSVVGRPGKPMWVISPMSH